MSITLISLHADDKSAVTLSARQTAAYSVISVSVGQNCVQFFINNNEEFKRICDLHDISVIDEE